MTTKPRNKRPRNKRSLSLEGRAAHALRELRAVGYAIAERQGADTRHGPPVEAIQIQLNIPLGDHATEKIAEEATRLVSDIDARMSTALKSLVAFKPGHVYCFQCDAPDCKHAGPPNPDHTFSGYTATGKPEWESFPNLCIARQEARVYRLWGDSPQIIAIVQDANELKEGLLPGFGHDSLFFNVLGQVVAGLVPCTVNTSDTKADRVALTLQVIETRSGKDDKRLQLNVIGLNVEEIATASAKSGSRGAAESLRRTLKTTRQKLRALSRRTCQAEKAGHPYDAAPTVSTLINHLKGDIERVFRPEHRRTSHAQERHLSGDRPTSRAMNDARQASDDKLLHDTRHDTIVVLGRRGRAHLFSDKGRHVTSLKLTPGEVDRKITSKRWQRLSAEQSKLFRDQIEPADE